MQYVKVKKDRLLETLKANKETHNADFDIAWEAYARKVRANVEELLLHVKNMKKGEPVNLYINLARPENHSEDYDRAVQMLDWEIGDEVELTETEFQQFVQDDWNWKGAFVTSNVLYTGSSSPSRESIHDRP